MQMNLRNLTALVLATVLLLTLTACGNTAKQPAADPAVSDTTTTTTAENTTSTTETTTATTTATTSQPVLKETSKKTTTSEKKVVTFTTEATTTSTTKDKSKGKAIKILAIGNSFSVDAMKNHLFDIFEAAGYTDITLGNLYIGGCSLDMHYANLRENKPAYTFYLNTDGEWSQHADTTPATAFGKARWDVVTIQQVSSTSGVAGSYVNLQKTLDLIKQKEPQAKIYWHMTWAYQQNSTHEAFVHYNKDQMTMYKAITSTVQSKVAPNKAIYGVIPSGTAIQNLRTSELGDTLTSDGYHLEDIYGDYTAALTWFCTITGEAPDATDYRPVRSYWGDITKAVSNALKKPYQITAC